MKTTAWMAATTAIALGLITGGCEELEGGGGSSAISLSNVVWLHENVSSWPVTTSLDVRISGDAITLDFPATRSWPARDNGGVQVNANPWIFVKREGTWYAATWEWFRPGQTSKPTGVVNGSHIGAAPLNDFRPVSGETYGFMVSTPARSRLRTLNERSDVVMARWP